MPVSDRNARVIATLETGFGRQVYLWVNDCEAEGIPLVLVEGHRPFKRSDELYRKGRAFKNGKWIVVDRRKVVTNAPAGFSYHNFALAVDAVLMNSAGQPTWDFDPHGTTWRRVVALAKARGLAWGGDWLTFKDPPHFQPANALTLAECRKRWPRGWPS